MTKIYDISETGISFMTPFRQAPKIGEIIKIEFAPPGSMQIACLGKVVRTEEPQGRGLAQTFELAKVGVAFYDLPPEYQKLLSQSIARSLGFQKKRTKTSFSFGLPSFRGQGTWIYNNIPSILLSFLIVAALIAGIYSLSQKMEDQKKPMTDAPWAKGFFDKVIPPQSK